MEKHHFHFTLCDTITVAQKACFVAGGKYRGSPPPPHAAQPSTPEGTMGKTRALVGAHARTPLYLAYVGVCSSTFLRDKKL